VPRDPDVLALDDTLNTLAALYQFRGLDERTFDTLTVSQSYCLRMLYKNGPQPMGALAGNLDVRLSTMTGIIDQLQNKGMVERVAHPADRRSFQVKLTVYGRRRYRIAHEAFLDHLDPLLEGRSRPARQHILEFLSDLIRTIQGWRSDPRKVSRHGKPHP
jgi:MarR family transcriptional regulator, organic hydroperoxide resistance regulator